jgi:hypothetical protein
MGERDISSVGVRESEAEESMSGNPESATSDGDTLEPVTEAVPEASDEHTLVGERAVGEDGTYATEAEPGWVGLRRSHDCAPVSFTM